MKEGENTDCIIVAVIFSRCSGFLPGEDSELIDFNRMLLWDGSPAVLPGCIQIYTGNLISCRCIISTL